MSIGSTRLAARACLIPLAAAAALLIPACASEQTVATMPASAPMVAAETPKTQVASAPLGYPWATAGASLSTASAKAPSVTR